MKREKNVRESKYLYSVCTYVYVSMLLKACMQMVGYLFLYLEGVYVLTNFNVCWVWYVYVYV